MERHIVPHIGHIELTRLGHSNVSITSDIYAHSLPGWQRQADEAFAEVMEGEGEQQARAS